MQTHKELYSLITGETSLHWAAENGHKQICKMIMDEINDKNPSGQFGKTPLHRAVQNGDEPLCQ